MVFQSFNLFPHLTVIGNIMLAPIDLLGENRQDAYKKGMELLRMVGLAEKAFSVAAPEMEKNPCDAGRAARCREKHPDKLFGTAG